MKKTRTQSRAAAVALDNEPRPFTLAGRVALVTGSSRGLGKAIAFALGAAGAKVALNFANGQEQADATFDEFAQRGYEGLLVRADVTNEKHVAKMCHAVSKRLGPIDIVVCNATPQQPQKPFELYDWAFHQQMLDFFVKSPFLLTRAVLPQMKERGRRAWRPNWRRGRSRSTRCRRAGSRSNATPTTPSSRRRPTRR
jgi:NAD(P)-dependent dehydrogenase (short-subunit alcohol dehydrogenase family)